MPAEDQGYVFLVTVLPQAAAISRTREVTAEATKALLRTGQNGGTICMHAENGGVITSLMDVYNNNIWLVEAIARNIVVD